MVEMAEKTTKKRTTKAATTKETSKAAKTKRAVKSTPARRAAVKESAPVVKEPVTDTAKPKGLRVRKSYLVFFLGILAIVALIFLAGKYLIAATVNGQSVARWSVIRELERQGGKQTLESLITKTLIEQEARKKNVTISEKEVNDEIKSIEQNLSQQGQKLDQVLQLQGMTRDQLIEQIRLQKMIEKMVGKITVTEKEIDDFITQNQESLPTDQDEKTQRANVKERLEQQKLNEKAQKFLEDIRKNAKVNYFVQY